MTMRSAAQLTSPLPKAAGSQQGPWHTLAILDPRRLMTDTRVVMVTPRSSGAVVATLVMTQRPAPAARRLAIPAGDGMATLVAPAMACVT
jgi:hypothetical protein